MGKIKNPNDIVESFVSDYHTVYGNQLISVFMYGSAVTHEYKPGKSDINILIVLEDTAISQISKSLHLQKSWSKCRVSTPFFFTKQYIADSCDTYPVEFLDMQSNYKVLYGEDLLKNLEIKHEHVRLQCERELRGVAVHLRRSYAQCAGNDTLLYALLDTSIRRLIPVFKGLLALKGRSITKSKSDSIALIEDTYNLGMSSFSDIFNLNKKDLKHQYDKLFEKYAQDIDKLVAAVDKLGGRETA